MHLSFKHALTLTMLTGAFSAPALAPAQPGHGATPPAPEHAPATTTKPSTAAAKPPAATTPTPKPITNGSKPTAAPTKPATTPSVADEPAPAPTAEQALAWLTEGNARWVANKNTNPNTNPERRAEIAEKGQTPFVTIITCADSRLPVERLFDRGVGELFVIRVAGNIAGTSETGTIEYGLGHLHTPLLVVMGHTRCGAVAVAAANGGADVHGKVRDLINAINPAVERAKRANPGLEGKDLAAAAVKENVWQTVFDLLRNSPEVRSLVSEGKVKVVGAVCDIATGKVDWMGEHPWQSELLVSLKARETTGSNANADGH